MTNAWWSLGLSNPMYEFSLHVSDGQSGKPMSVYSPWFRKWIALVHAQPSYLEPSPKPSRNPLGFYQSHKDTYDLAIPEVPDSHKLATEERTRFAALWPAGEHAAKERLIKFCNEKIHDYALHRSEPGAEATSCLSVHLSQGTISARACIRRARAADVSKRLDKGKDGNISWISEVAWRDFYRRECLRSRSLKSRRVSSLASCLQKQSLQTRLR